jgi:hypothetical protein
MGKRPGHDRSSFRGLEKFKCLFWMTKMGIGQKHIEIFQRPSSRRGGKWFGQTKDNDSTKEGGMICHLFSKIKEIVYTVDRPYHQDQRLFGLDCLVGSFRKLISRDYLVPIMRIVQEQSRLIPGKNRLERVLLSPEENLEKLLRNQNSLQC